MANRLFHVESLRTFEARSEDLEIPSEKKQKSRHDSIRSSWVIANSRPIACLASPEYRSSSLMSRRTGFYLEFTSFFHSILFEFCSSGCSMPPLLLLLQLQA